MSMNDSVSSPIINGSTDPEYHQKLLTMMEANGQYPINIDQSVMDSAKHTTKPWTKWNYES